MALTNSRIYKVAGLSLLGFCALSIGADRANIGPVATQVAGFCGAFLGALAAPRRKRSIDKSSPAAVKEEHDGPAQPSN